MEFEPHHRKLEETVIGILKSADLEIATELSVRTEAEKLLAVDLSDLASKRLVRRILESFLLSSSPADEAQEETDDVEEELQTEKLSVGDGKVACDDGGGRLICKLPGMKRVSIQKFRETKLVSIREYHQTEGKVFPSGRGITLNPKQWSVFRSSFPDIEAAITKMEAGIRGQGMEKKQNDAEPSNLVSETHVLEQPQTQPQPSNLVSEPHVLEKPQTQPQPQPSNLVSEPLVLEKSQTQPSNLVFEPHVLEKSQPSNLVSEPHAVEQVQIYPLIPIAITRFTGRNYYCWKRQMEFFLNQLSISYVLTNSFPISPPTSSSFKEFSRFRFHQQKWMNDDYLCRQTILNSLSDQLFEQYSVKNLNAQQLWDELKSSYDDDFGTKRSHVNNYLQFQMIDGVSVLEQVEELHRIAGVINSCGINIDENFHVSAIISKLPPSWKHIRVKLMQENHLPLDKLIYKLKDEEDYRIGGGKRKKSGEFGQKKSKKSGDVGQKRKSYQWCRLQGSVQPSEG